MSGGWSWLGWGLLAILVLWGIGAFNRLMRLRNTIGEAFKQLDLALTARAEAAGKLLTLLRPLLTNELATFDALETAQNEALSAAQLARAKPYAGDPLASLAVATAVHGAALTRLNSLVEHHGELSGLPELNALLDELKLIERQRAFARQVFNQAVTQYNEALQQFPTRILAGVYGFAEARSL